MFYQSYRHEISPIGKLIELCFLGIQRQEKTIFICSFSKLCSRREEKLRLTVYGNVHISRKGAKIAQKTIAIFAMESRNQLRMQIHAIAPFVSLHFAN